MISDLPDPIIVFFSGLVIVSGLVLFVMACVSLVAKSRRRSKLP